MTTSLLFNIVNHAAFGAELEVHCGFDSGCTLKLISSTTGPLLSGAESRIGSSPSISPVETAFDNNSGSGLKLGLEAGLPRVAGLAFGDISKSSCLWKQCLCQWSSCGCMPCACTNPRFSPHSLDPFCTLSTGKGPSSHPPPRYIQSHDLSKAQESLDLSGATSRLCLEKTGALPVRPHMLLFNRAGSHAVVAFVASGHVVIFRARDRTPVACFRTSPGFNGLRQAHAGYPTKDDQYIVVANQNGKKVERINVDWQNEVFVHDVNATLSMYGDCTTPSGAKCEDPALRPDNAPICTPSLADPRLTFVTLRGGGMFVVDYARTPMQIVAEYDNRTIGSNGCGGVSAGDYMYINSGGGTAANLYEFKVYKLPHTGYSAANPPNTPAPKVVANDEKGDRDAHYAGIAMSKSGRPKYFWQPDRYNSVIDVFSFRTDRFVNRIDLKAANLSADPTPDALVISPAQDHAFLSLRGLFPVSADPHVSTGLTPGLAVLTIQSSGRDAVFERILPITNLVGGVNRADPHGLDLRVSRGVCGKGGVRRMLR